MYLCQIITLAIVALATVLIIYLRFNSVEVKMVLTTVEKI